MPSPAMAETRKATLDACRRSLREHVGRFREVKDELFIVNQHIVRPKGTGTAEEDWVWDPAVPGAMQPVREEFYLLHDVNEPDAFYIVPSEFVRGALEGAHFQWYLEGFGEDEQDGSATNDRQLERNTMRRLRKWPIRHFKNAWHLLQGTDLAYGEPATAPSEPTRDKDQSRAALLARGYTECAIGTCRRLIKNMTKHKAAHASGLLDDHGIRTDKPGERRDHEIDELARKYQMRPADMKRVLDENGGRLPEWLTDPIPSRGSGIAVNRTGVVRTQ